MRSEDVSSIIAADTQVVLYFMVMCYIIYQAMQNWRRGIPFLFLGGVVSFPKFSFQFAILQKFYLLRLGHTFISINISIYSAAGNICSSYRPLNFSQPLLQTIWNPPPSLWQTLWLLPKSDFQAKIEENQTWHTAVIWESHEVINDWCRVIL